MRVTHSFVYFLTIANYQIETLYLALHWGFAGYVCRCKNHGLLSSEALGWPVASKRNIDINCILVEYVISGVVLRHYSCKLGD